jgi:putative sterol carrier protein
MGDLFRPPARIGKKDLTQKGEKAMKILAIQGSPRPEMANLWWDGHLEGITRGKPVQGKVEDMRLLLREMAASFNSQAAGDLKATIQFEVTGKQAGDWFLSIDLGKCTCHEGKVNSPDLTIKTPSEVWLAIATKEMDGQQAFMEGRYTATGDMSLLMRMRALFGSGASQKT